MNIPFLDLKRIPVGIKDELTRTFRRMLEEGIFSGGKEVNLFENNIASYLNIPDFVSCSNGTDALEIALRLLNIGPGDKVAVPALTWVSTAEVVKLTGAELVFVDTDKDGLIDLDNLIELPLDHLKAVIPVHLYGQIAAMEKLCKWSKEKGIKVIEDAAQSFGAKLGNKASGAWGDIGCFSFYPTKNLGALGEAGGIFCKDEELMLRARQMINHGQSYRDKHEILGKNARIDSIQATFLNVMLNYFDQWQIQRKELAKIYLEELSEIKALKLPLNCMQSQHSLHLFTLQTPLRDELRAFLLENGIGTAVHYPQIIPKMKPYHDGKSYPNAQKISQQTLSLPLNPFLTKKEVLYISRFIREFFKNQKTSFAIL